MVPIDGSSNIEMNVSMGTIFSVLPVARPLEGTGLASFMQPGAAQLAAGFFVYGPQLALVLTLGAGTRVFISTRRGVFVEAYANLQIPQKAPDFSINASNYRHWDEPVRQYIDDCLQGAAGPHGRDYNMRWIASMVAEAYRILIRGGVYLYPTDSRKGYGKGRLRLVNEANPIAMVIEQAGGLATDTVSRILELKPTSLHQRVAMVFGSSADVARIERYHTDPARYGDRKPLFGTRGLFRT
jgi:fructose-1,6-bisphosphatase I